MNIIKIAKDLQNAGLDEKAAEAIANAVAEAFQDSIRPESCKEEIIYSGNNNSIGVGVLLSRITTEREILEYNIKQYISRGFRLVCGFIGSMVAVLIFYAEWRWFK